MEPALPPAPAPIHPGLDFVLGLAGAAAGGFLGYLVVGWLVRQGFYAVALPGMLVGLGAGLMSKKRSVALAATCGTAALGLGVFTEWSQFPFIKDSSLRYFLAHLSDLKPITLLMIALGGFAGAWFAWRTRPRSRSQPGL